MDICLTDNAFKYKNPKKIKECVDRFLAGDFGGESLNAYRATAFGKCFERPEHEQTAFGVYSLSDSITCYVIYHKAYCNHMGFNSLIVALNEDINLLLNDPLQTIVDKVIAAESNGHSTFH